MGAQDTMKIPFFKANNAEQGYFIMAEDLEKLQKKQQLKNLILLNAYPL